MTYEADTRNRHFQFWKNRFFEEEYCITKLSPSWYSFDYASVLAKPIGGPVLSTGISPIDQQYFNEYFENVTQANFKSKSEIKANRIESDVDSFLYLPMPIVLTKISSIKQILF